MEQVATVFGLDWRLLIIQAVNFGLLLVIMWRFLYRPLARIMDERQKVIEKGVHDSEKAEQRLKEIEAERTGVLKKAATESDSIIEQATKHAKEKESEIVTDARTHGDHIVRDAEQKAEEIRKQAYEESKADIARIAVLSAEKILRERADA